MVFNAVFVLCLPLFILSFVQGDTSLGNVFAYSQNMGYAAMMSENCTIAFEEFSQSVINFTNCYIKYARPIHVCMNCAKQHTAFNDAYQHLKNQGQKCQSFFFSSDQLSILDIVYNNGNNLWLKGYCPNCYDHYNETERFFQASNSFIWCLETTNSTSNVAANNTCVKCHEAYVNLSTSYNKFVHWKKEFVGGICMDIVDMMNMSRKAWSEYDCAVGFDFTIGFPNILTALTVGATPLMFYLLAKNISRLEDVKLVRPKRKITVFVPPPPPLEG